MIEIGKNFLYNWTSAQQSRKNQQEKYHLLAGQIEQQMEETRQTYEQNVAYLFRTQAEKMRLAYENARQALAQRQALRAAHGVGDTSASAVQDSSVTQLNQALQSQRTEKELQQAGAQEEKNFKSQWQSLLQKAAAYRRAAGKSGKMGSWGRAFISLFK